jgi:hypothetical protein
MAVKFTASRLHRLNKNLITTEFDIIYQAFLKQVTAFAAKIASVWAVNQLFRPFKQALVTLTFYPYDGSEKISYSFWHIPVG